MPTPCYAKILGSTQGMITKGASTSDSIGDQYVEGHEEEMLIQEVSHSVIVPTDPQSGQPSYKLPPHRLGPFKLWHFRI